MMNEIQANRSHEINVAGVVVGMLVGGLAGAVAMLLLAPQSGEDTRKQIQKKGIELRDRTTEALEDTLTQVRAGTNKIAMDVKNYGQELAVEQLDHVSEAAQAGKKAIERS